MKVLPLLTGLFLSSTLYAIEALTVAGVTYLNVSVKSEYPKSFFIRHDGGTVFINRADLTEQQIEELLADKNKLGELKDKASKGDALSQVEMGIAYAEGNGVQQDHAEAVTWYRKAAESGLGLAQYNLAHAYLAGQGVPQDAQQALSWFSKAAANENLTDETRSAAQMMLSQLSSNTATATSTPEPSYSQTKNPLLDGISVDGDSMSKITASDSSTRSTLKVTLYPDNTVLITQWVGDLYAYKDGLQLSSAEIPKSQTELLSQHLKKFLEWEDKSDKEGLDNFSKQIGEVGEYKSVFKKENGGAICKLVHKDGTDEESLFSEAVARYLSSMLDNLAGSMQKNLTTNSTDGTDHRVL
jgi:hypothetical protein